MSIVPAMTAEQQNQSEPQSLCLQPVKPGKHLTLLAIQTAAALTDGQNDSISRKLKALYGVEEIATAFSSPIPDFGEEYENALHVSAALRTKRKAMAPTEPTEAVTAPVTNSASGEVVSASSDVQAVAHAVTPTVAEAATAAEPATPVEVTPPATPSAVPASTGTVGTPTPSNESI